MKKLTQDRLRCEESVNLNPDVIGPLVFGGKDPVTGVSGCVNAFSKAFCVAKNKACWAKFVQPL